MAEQFLENGRTMTDEELEKKAKPYVIAINAVSILMLLGIGILIVGIAIMIITNQNFTPLTTIMVLGGFALVFFCIFASYQLKEKYNVIMMEELGPQIEGIIASYIGPDLKQEDDMAVRKRLQQSIADANLCPGFNSCNIDSYRKGAWKGQIFEAFNAELSETKEVMKEGADGEQESTTETTTLFKGTCMFVELKKEVPTPVLIREVKKKERKDPYWNITMENPEFSKQYCVHAEDPHLAYYILTPQFMEQLQELAQYAGASCGFCFSGRTLYMTIYGGEKFLNMDGQSNEHIKNLMDNLKASLEHTGGLLDRLLVNDSLFGE